ncbi:hypothetical protein [Glutamicibacter sp. NPDC087344]|uniref:hypothetical protein n=1 Tax=Glutamicibacter sp. NPDC087344 TaxID=3363994 RepID=UPI00380A5A06
MGASNVAKVFIHWADSSLTPLEKLALIYMANVALDADAPPVYFGGSAALADALGEDGNALRNRYAPVDDEDAQRTQQRKAKAVEEKVRRILTALGKAGAVVSSNDAHRSRSNDYALCLDPGISYKPIERVRVDKYLRMAWEPVDNRSSPTKLVGHPSKETVGHKHKTCGALSKETVGQHPTKTVGPRSKEDPTNEYMEEKIQSVSQLTTAREAEFLDDDEPRTPEQERQRQLAALKPMMQAESEKSA